MLGGTTGQQDLSCSGVRRLVVHIALHGGDEAGVVQSGAGQGKRTVNGNVPREGLGPAATADQIKISEHGDRLVSAVETDGAAGGGVGACARGERASDPNDAVCAEGPCPG